MSVAVPPNDADRVQLEPSWKATVFASGSTDTATVEGRNAIPCS